ncbi:WYL domain-containing protein [Streptomyces sp. NPDC006872]|uniref:helix-turn-helix transcriptional regulator n=1 Tax=Streptomyces sp. NPDC006872 TaxID=3155720 RepID=UPI003411EE02
MKSDRLLSILLLLQTHGQLPAVELAARLEVSARTIMRDVEALSAAGVPVYTERGRGGGIALMPGYRTDVTGLTADEAKALFVLVTDRAHTDLGLGPAIGSALRKVMAALPAPHRDAADLVSRRILVDPVRWRSDPPPPTDLGVLQEAVFTDRRLRLRYRRGRDGQERSYTLDPYGLVNKAGVWYLVADHNGQARLFRADRILSTSLADEPVQRRKGVELADVWDELRRNVDEMPDGIPVVVRVRRTALQWFLPLYRSDMTAPPPTVGLVSEGDEEWVEFQLRFTTLGSAQPLLAFANDLEVVSPPELRDDLARKATATAALYT